MTVSEEIIDTERISMRLTRGQATLTYDAFQNQEDGLSNLLTFLRLDPHPVMRTVWKSDPLLPEGSKIADGEEVDVEKTRRAEEFEKRIDAQLQQIRLLKHALEHIGISKWGRGWQNV